MGITIVDKNTLIELVNLSLLLFPEESYDERHKTYLNVINSEKEEGLLYEIEGKFVGYMHISVRSDYVNGTDTSPVAFVEAIFVLPEYREKGIARKFIEYSETFARERGIKQLASDCFIDNTLSETFHRSCGFIEKERVICFVKDLTFL